MNEYNSERPPSWFFLVRAMVLLMLGSGMLIYETGFDPSDRWAIVAAGLVLLGFAPGDIAAFVQGKMK